MPLLKKDGIMVIEDIGLNYELKNGLANEDFMIMNENKVQMPIYENFMLNYKNIRKDVFHKLNAFTLNTKDIKLLDNINIDWEAPINSSVCFEDMDLKGQNLITDFLGNSKLAFLTYKNKL